MKDSSTKILNDKDREMLLCSYQHLLKNDNPPGIKPFNLQGILGFYNTTFNLHLKRLIELDLLRYTSNRLINLTVLGKEECVKLYLETEAGREANNTTNKKEKRGISKREKAVARKDKIKFYVLFLAASGVTFQRVLTENRSFNTKPLKITPSIQINEILLNQVIAASPYTKVNDFYRTNQIFEYADKYDLGQYTEQFC